MMHDDISLFFVVSWGIYKLSIKNGLIFNLKPRFFMNFRIEF